MPRPRCNRKVDSPPHCNCFKPAGIPSRDLEEVVLTVDEYEAIRLADLEGLYQEKVAESMGVSRQTVGRILVSAHRKVATALVKGWAIRIEGGTYITDEEGLRKFSCMSCHHGWEIPHGGGRPEGCPQCGNADVRRGDASRGRGRGGCGTGRGRGRCGK